MKPVVIAFLLAASALLVPQFAAAADLQVDQQVVFSDGTKASTYDHCGDTDLCALMVYTNGDRLSIYSEGAAYCQPYVLRFVKTNGTATIFEYSRTINHDVPASSGFGTRCGNSRDTQMVMDHGLIHMTVSENHDGTLSIVFTPTQQGDMRQQSEPPETTETPIPLPTP
jgi:hypothetical protein